MDNDPAIKGYDIGADRCSGAFRHQPFNPLLHHENQMKTSAKIILDSVSPAGARITTMQLVYPRFIHSEFMTHRVFSRIEPGDPGRQDDRASPQRPGHADPLGR
jgi:hypothetical protein